MPFCLEIEELIAVLGEKERERGGETGEEIGQGGGIREVFERGGGERWKEWEG